MEYDAWGNIISESGTGELGRYAWTGREFDTETELQYNRARYYDPALGRWITQDPLGFDAGDSNLYRYISNGPVSSLDPSGLQVSPPAFLNKGNSPRRLTRSETLILTVFLVPLNKSRNTEGTRVNDRLDPQEFRIVSSTLFAVNGEQNKVKQHTFLERQIIRAAHLTDIGAITMVPGVYFNRKTLQTITSDLRNFTKTGASATTPASAGLVAHELQHVIQQLREFHPGVDPVTGRGNFLVEYGKEAKRLPYDKISYEIEAKAVQDAVQSVLSIKKNRNIFDSLRKKMLATVGTNKEWNLHRDPLAKSLFQQFERRFRANVGGPNSDIYKRVHGKKATLLRTTIRDTAYELYRKGGLLRKQ